MHQTLWGGEENCLDVWIFSGSIQFKSQSPPLELICSLKLHSGCDFSPVKVNSRCWGKSLRVCGELSGERQTIITEMAALSHMPRRNQVSGPEETNATWLHLRVSYGCKTNITRKVVFLNVTCSFSAPQWQLDTLQRESNRWRVISKPKAIFPNWNIQFVF